MTRARSTLIKFAVFATVMSVLTVFLFMAFGEFRSGKVNSYSAVIDDADQPPAVAHRPRHLLRCQYHRGRAVADG